jgi:hypothetical protein
VILVGLFSGVMVSGALVEVGARCLDTPGRALAHYACALALALLLEWFSTRTARLATGALAVLLTFALRRWLGLRFWINLEALDWGSGPAGQLAALVFPLEGLIFGVVAAADAQRH